MSENTKENELEQNKRFYWLKLDRRFFKQHEIVVIEGLPNGKDYILFYLKLLCESVSHEGNLRFSEEIPYDEAMLASITNTNIDIVRAAVQIFTKLHMMEILDDGTYFMNKVQGMMGSETDWAKKKRDYRERQKAIEEGQSEDNVLPLSDKSTESRVKSSDINKTIHDSFIEGHTNLEHGENDDSYHDSYHDSPEVDTKTAAYNGVKAHDVALEWQKRFAGIDGLSATGKITVQKETAIGTILQHYSVEEINQTFDKLAKSEFLLGGNPSGWKATFDWFIKLDNFDKVFSGNYDNHKGKKDKKFTPTDISGQYADFQPEVIEL